MYTKDGSNGLYVAKSNVYGWSFVIRDSTSGVCGGQTRIRQNHDDPRIPLPSLETEIWMKLNYEVPSIKVQCLGKDINIGLRKEIIDIDITGGCSTLFEFEYHFLCLIHVCVNDVRLKCNSLYLIWTLWRC